MRSEARPSSPRRKQSYTFLTAHGAAVLLLEREPDLRIAELAERLGVTERTAQVIVNDLVRDSYVSKERRGRRNHYTVAKRFCLRRDGLEYVDLAMLFPQNHEDSFSEDTMHSRTSSQDAGSSASD